MRNSKHFILSLTFIFIVNFATSQQIDSALILKHLKMDLFSELDLGLISKEALNNYLKLELKATVLKSKGFENYIFYKIGSQILASDTLTQTKTINIYSTPNCLNAGKECYYVFAYNIMNQKFYKLKGTYNNDFYDFYYTLEQWQYWKGASKVNKKTINHFNEDFWIDGIDLKCLLYSLSGKKGNCLEPFSKKIIMD